MFEFFRKWETRRFLISWLHIVTKFVKMQYTWEKTLCQKNERKTIQDRIFDRTAPKFYTYLLTFLILNEADLARSGMLLFFVPPIEGAAMYCPGPGVTYCTQVRQCLIHSSQFPVFRIRIGSELDQESGSAVNFSYFWSSKSRIRIGIQPKMLDPDPDQMITDPKHE